MAVRTMKMQFQRAASTVLTFALLATTILPCLESRAATAEELPAHRIFISEVYGNDIGRSGEYGANADVDLMDYIELYNDSGAAVVFSDLYDLRYCAAGGAPAPLAFESEGPITIPANSAVVVWIKRGDLAKDGVILPDEAAFRAAFSIADNVPVYATKGQKALSNKAGDVVQVTEKDGTVISGVVCNAFDSTMEGKSYHYYRQEVDTALAVFGSSIVPTAGVIDEGQKAFLPAPEPPESNFNPYDLFISEVYANDIVRSYPGLAAADDAMDYFELCNGGAVDITLSDGLTLGYKANGKDTFKALTDFGGVDPIIPAGGTAIFWLKRSDIQSTVEEFRAAFSVSPEIPVYTVLGVNALGNKTGDIQITKTGDTMVTSTVTYPTFSTEPHQGTSMHYQRKAAGESGLEVWQEFTQPTPGVVDPKQKEYIPVDPGPKPDLDHSPVYLSEIYPDDGQALEGLTINGSDLVEGAHTLTAEVSDVCGNQGSVTVDFTSAVRYPVFGAMEQETAAGSAALTAKLGDHASEATVTFYPGMTYTVHGGITVAQGWGDATGASVPGSIGAVNAPDGELPYQIYTVRTDGKNGDTLKIEVEGETDYGKTLLLYALDVEENAWMPLETRQVAGGVEAEFRVDGFLRDGAVQILAQGRGTETIPSTGAPFSNTQENDYVWDGRGEPEQYDFSVVWMTDTQYYTESYPDQYDIQNKWIADNKDRFNTRYVVHTGDVVDDFDQEWEWEVGDRSMKLLEDAKIPYGVLGGNHDVGSGNRCYDYYWKYFGEERFQNSPAYGGSYANNLGHYDLVTSDGVELLFLYMSWDVYDDEIEWMNEVLAQYPERKAILCFHSYVVASTAELDYIGERVQKEVVARNPNVLAVLNGHYHGSSLNITAFDDDNDGVKERLVYQLCTDYQSGERGGLAYVKTLYFDLANGKVYLNSYSPYKKDFNYYDTTKLASYTDGVKVTQMDICEWDVDFTRPARTLTVSDVKATLYGGSPIAAAQASDGAAGIRYSGLSSRTDYGWYAVAENGLGLRSRSPVQTFTSAEYETSGGGVSSGTKTETVKNPDGSTTKTVTNTKTGTVTATTTWPNGTKTAVETKKDGSVTAAVTLPPTVEQIVASIPVPGAGPGTVAVLIGEDGTETVVKMSSTDGERVLVPLGSSAKLRFEERGVTFGDMPAGNWAADAVAFVSSRGLFQGTSQTSFSPSMPVSRSMLVTALYRLENEPGTDASSFHDVPVGTWYSQAAAWAGEKGIVTGTGAGFDPEGEITRESLAVMLYRFAGKLSVDSLEAQSGKSFADLADVSDWANEAIAWAVGAGIFSGKSGGRLDPAGTATRGEVAVMLMRFVSYMNQK